MPTTMLANNYGVESNMPPDAPSKRVDILDFDEIMSKVQAGAKVSICRCYKSKKFPYCDGSHVKHNEETGDNIAPAVLTAGLPAEKRGLNFITKASEMERNRVVKGPRANNYGVDSNVPPDNPTKKVDLLDVEDLEKVISEKGAVSLCRCFKSATFPLCNGAHVSHNKETGDNAGPLVLKKLGGGAAPPPPEKAVVDGDLRLISLDELAKHAKEGDQWTAIHGIVYDVTEWIPDHPGGDALLGQYAGKTYSHPYVCMDMWIADEAVAVRLEIADEGFDGVHQEYVLAENLGKDKVMGRLSDEDAAKGKVVIAYTPPPIESVLNLYDLEAIAQQSMKDTSWGYYFTGATDEYTKCGNQEIYRRLRLVPRVMRNVSNVQMATTMLGHATAFPVYISGAAKGGLAHEDAEEALCRASYTAGVLQMCPHMATKTHEQMAAARGKDQVQFLQLYVEKDRDASAATVKAANELGFQGLFLTVDSAGIGKRERDLRTTPGGSAPRSAATKRRWADDLTWADIPWFRSLTSMPLVLKGVQSGADAVMAYDNGLNGIVVSNHGGRNMDTARPALEALIEIMAALRAHNFDPSKFEVYVDGGIKRGSDVFKALAIGAKGVGIGRAALFGMAAYGQAGVEKTLEILSDELYTTMQMMGTPTLADIKPEMVHGIEHVPAWSWSISRDHLPSLNI